MEITQVPSSCQQGVHTSGDQLEPEELPTMVVLSPLEMRENTGALAPPRKPTKTLTRRASPEKLWWQCPLPAKAMTCLSRENTGISAPPRESAEACTSGAVPEKLLKAAPTPCKSSELLEQGKHRHLSFAQRICRGLSQWASTRRATGSIIHFFERNSSACFLMELWASHPGKSTR